MSAKGSVDLKGQSALATYILTIKFMIYTHWFVKYTIYKCLLSLVQTSNPVPGELLSCRSGFPKLGPGALPGCMFWVLP